MRVNQILYSNTFQAFLNSISFVLTIVCFILTILLPLPYHQEPPGIISLQGYVNGDNIAQFQKEAPPIIALGVLVPFLCGIIFMLLYRITYVKSKNEVKREIGENVKFDYISNEIKNDWELSIENHINTRKHRETEMEIARKKAFIEMTKKNQEMEEKLNKLLESVNEKSNKTTKEKDMI